MNTNNGIDSVLADMRATAAQLAPRASASASSAPAGAAFADALQQALRDVSARQAQSESLRQRLDTDPNATLQDVVIESSKASLSFQMMVQVRERLVAAYREVMNMQI
jgi:flagellar hook-basal body complex protein FliE